MRKRSFLLFVISSLILVLFACSKPDVKDLYLRITWTDYSGKGVAIQKVIDTYNQDNDKYRIILQSGDEDFDKLNSDLLDEEHNTIYVLPYRFVRYFGSENLLIDLTDQFVNEEALFYPALWDLGTVNQSVYGIPWVSHSICLIYNKEILDLAGVDPVGITSLDTLVDALKLVNQNTEAYGIGLVGSNHNDISWMVNQFIYGFGSRLVDTTGTKVLINNEQSKEAITFYKNVLGQYAQPTWLDDTGVEIMNYFREEKLAFEFQGVWGVTDIEKNGSSFETGIINLNDIGLSPEVGPLLLSVDSGMTQNDQVEAIQFIKYMISTDAQIEIMKGEYSPERDRYYPFRVPARKDLTDSLVFVENPQYIPFAAGFENPSIDVPTAKWQTIKNEIYASGLSKVMNNTLTIDEFLNQVENVGNRILNQ